MALNYYLHSKIIILTLIDKILLFYLKILKPTTVRYVYDHQKRSI